LLSRQKYIHNGSAIGIAGVLIWLWISSYQWIAPVAFSSVKTTTDHIQVAELTAGQWFWLMNKQGGSQPQPLNPGVSPHITLTAGQPVAAHSVDVNHRFGIMKESLGLHKRVIPKLDQKN
jgi:hypothetical protein